MKRLFHIFVCVALAVVAVSCNDVEEAAFDDGSLVVTVFNDHVATKAASKEALTFEKQINRLDFFLFEKRGNNITRYKHEPVVGNPSISFDANGKYSKTFSKLPITENGYTVVVVANAPATVADCATYDALKAYAANLANCSRSANTGFIMYGVNESAQAVNTQSPSETAIELMRFPARVRLKSVINGIPSSAAYANNNSISVKGIFLTDVNSTWTLGAASNTLGGKINNNLTSVTGTSSLQVGEMTGYFLPDAVPVANGATVDFTTSTYPARCDVYGFPTSIPTTGRAPRVVVLAAVNGTDYYFPVDLPDGLLRNNAYEVNVTILGTGSTDPYTKVVRGNLKASVTVAEWAAGQIYSEEV